MDVSRSNHVYTELRRGLLLGKYPLIERLAEVRLAEQFGASRTPVREALVRLDSEGLVVRRPEGGFYPRSPNLADIRDLYELRRLIEVASLGRPSSSARRTTRRRCARSMTNGRRSPPIPDRRTPMSC